MSQGGSPALEDIVQQVARILAKDPGRAIGIAAIVAVMPEAANVDADLVKHISEMIRNFIGRSPDTQCAANSNAGAIIARALVQEYGCMQPLVQARAPISQSGSDPAASYKTMSIIQSNYIPWRGYFDILRKSDEFVIGDNVQYTKQDWRNRNRIKTPNGVVWLTIPVHSASRISASRRIDGIRIADAGWCDTHLQILARSYHKARFFDQVASWLFPLFREVAKEPLLTAINEHLLRGIALRLGIKTRFLRTSDLDDGVDGMERSERILALCKAAGATRYLSGPSARSYLNEAMLKENGICVEWMDYSGYTEYPQLWGGFEPNVSIVDLLFNTGSRAAAQIGRTDQASRAIAHAGSSG